MAGLGQAAGVDGHPLQARGAELLEGGGDFGVADGGITGQQEDRVDPGADLGHEGAPGGQDLPRVGFGVTDVVGALLGGDRALPGQALLEDGPDQPGLVRAIIEKGLAGEGPVPAEQRSDHIRDTEPDPRKILAAAGAFTAEIAPRVAPIFLLARDAAVGDPEIAATLEEISAARHERMTVNARGLAKAGHLRPGITVEQAADIMWALTSVELYELLILRRGWTPERYGQFTAQVMLPALGT